MRNILLIILSLTLTNCNSKEYKETTSESSSTNKETLKDTLITYNIEGVSSEGTEAKITYKSKKNYAGKINIYGETGQAELIYKFFPTNIEVTEKRYEYKKDLKSVNEKEDLILANTVTYKVDYEGNILSNKPKEYIDIFKELKESVPFELK